MKDIREARKEAAAAAILDDSSAGVTASIINSAAEEDAQEVQETDKPKKRRGKDPLFDDARKPKKDSHMSILVTSELKDYITKESERQGISTNAFINTIIEAWRDGKIS